MEQNMTALVSLFARAYHQKNKDIKIFDDLLSVTPSLIKVVPVIAKTSVTDVSKVYAPYYTVLSPRN